MEKSSLFFFIFILSLLLSVRVYAEPAFLGVSVGYFNLFDPPPAGEVDVRLEYRSNKSFIFKGLRPWAGIQVASDTSLWAGAGLFKDIKLTNRLYLTPSFGIGYYARGHSELDLGYPVEFRSQLELAYAFENQNRVALAISHTSNAHVGDRNPGTEVLALYWYFPIDNMRKYFGI